MDWNSQGRPLLHPTTMSVNLALSLSLLSSPPPLTAGHHNFFFTFLPPSFLPFFTFLSLLLFFPELCPPAPPFPCHLSLYISLAPYSSLHSLCFSQSSSTPANCTPRHLPSTPSSLSPVLLFSLALGGREGRKTQYRAFSFRFSIIN